MRDDENKPTSDDDAYVIEDTGETVEDIEDEMERTAREAQRLGGVSVRPERLGRLRALPSEREHARYLFATLLAEPSELRARASEREELDDAVEGRVGCRGRGHGPAE